MQTKTINDWEAIFSEDPSLADEVRVVLKALQECFPNGGSEAFKRRGIEHVGDGDVIMTSKGSIEDEWVFKEAMNLYDQLKRNEEWAEKEYPYFHK